MTVAGTTPYPWPYHGAADPAGAALLVTGAGPAWAAFVPRDDGAAAALERLRSELSAVGVLVVVVVADPPWPRLVPASEPSAPIEPRTGELVVHAAGLDGFYGSPLAAVLRRNGRRDLLVAGLGLETTVHGTVRRANDRGDECLTVIDACAPHDRSILANSRGSIEMSGGIFGAVGETDAVLAAFAGSASGSDTTTHERTSS